MKRFELNDRVKKLKLSLVKFSNMMGKKYALGRYRPTDDLPPEYEKFIEILEENEKLKAENQMFKNMCSVLLNQINNGD